MTEVEWLDATEVWGMLLLLKGRATARQLRLFACGFPRLSWRLLREEQSRKAVEVAEAFADGQATAEQLAEANRASEALVDWDRNVPDWEGDWANHPLAKMAALAARADAYSAAWLVPQMISDIGYYGGADPDYPKAKLEAAAKDLRRFAPLLRCVFGNPFRPVALSPSWLTPQVKVLAEQTYDERGFNRLPVLADTLERAGCTNSAILAHCREPGEHIRACWAVDLLLGKT
jgi:hypothetical protein